MQQMKRVSDWCYQNINTKIFIISVVIFILFMTTVLSQVAENSLEATGTKTFLPESTEYVAIEGGNHA